MRLTKPNGSYCDNCGQARNEYCRCDEEIAMYEKLKQYEDAEDQKIHAHWIDENPEDLLDVRMRCSNCRTIHDPYIYWHYCPSCGAIMDETIGKREIT